MLELLEGRLKVMSFALLKLVADLHLLELLMQCIWVLDMASLDRGILKLVGEHLDLVSLDSAGLQGHQLGEFRMKIDFLQLFALDM